ncbi:MAG: hypothetical protein K8R59_04725 [Thermoanaerobaculales bacterium]|nr:hypothetical protein [Thermoanaerobaculales bacterium]
MEERPDEEDRPPPEDDLADGEDRPLPEDEFADGEDRPLPEDELADEDERDGEEAFGALPLEGVVDVLPAEADGRDEVARGLPELVTLGRDG